MEIMSFEVNLENIRATCFFLVNHFEKSESTFGNRIWCILSFAEPALSLHSDKNVKWLS